MISVETWSSHWTLEDRMVWSPDGMSLQPIIWPAWTLWCPSCFHSSGNGGTNNDYSMNTCFVLATVIDIIEFHFHGVPGNIPFISLKREIVITVYQRNQDLRLYLCDSVHWCNKYYVLCFIFHADIWGGSDIRWTGPCHCRMYWHETDNKSYIDFI